MSETSKIKLPEGWENRTDGVEDVYYQPIANMPRDVAAGVVRFIDDYYGDKLDSADACEGLWMAMQLLAGPQKAASVLRGCSVDLTAR